MREAATRLGISTGEMEGMVKRGDGEVGGGGVDDDGAGERFASSTLRRWPEVLRRIVRGV